MLNLREQLYYETRAMAEYALANGLGVQAVTIRTLEAFEYSVVDDEHKVANSKNLVIDDLVRAHSALVKLVEPAKPSTILLLDVGKKSNGLLKFLGPVSLVRQLMVAAIISLILFMSLVLSASVNPDGGNILESDGIPLLLNLLFFLAAAGLGASFSALYKANTFISDGTFDPTYSSSYWVRFFLGLISGLILSVIISKHFFDDPRASTTMLEPGIMRPLLAMLGGFSADLAHTILSRLVETVESLFRGSAKSLINAQVMDKQSRLANIQIQQQSKMAVNLLQLQQQISTSENSTEVKAAINKMLANIVPVGDFQIESPAEKNTR